MAHVLHGGVVWLDPAPPASSRAIEAITRRVGTRLPDPYVDLLRSANGGDLHYQLRLSPNTEREDVAAFTGWFRASEPEEVGGSDTVLGELALLDASRFRDRLPGAVIPLARTGGEDDTLILDVSPDGFGTVWAWMTGIAPGWGRPTKDALHYVAHELDDLYGQLFIDDDLKEMWPDDRGATTADRQAREAWLSSRQDDEQTAGS